MKMKEKKKDYRVLTESEMRDDQLLDTLKTVHKLKKDYSSR